jgi:chromosome partitioning protein
MTRPLLISFSNHKGGTGKTTSTLNVACALRDLGKKVAVVDLDPQANLSYSLGYKDHAYGIIELLNHRCSIQQAVIRCEGISLLPMHTNFLDDDASALDSCNRLDFIATLSELDVDVVLIDCPPATGQLTRLALASSDYVMIPMLLEVLSIQGLEQILQFINRIQINENADLQVLGVLAVCVNDSRKLTTEVLEYISNKYDVHVFNNRVHNNVKAAEAPSFAKSVIDYAPNSLSARDYRAVAGELLQILQSQTLLH